MINEIGKKLKQLRKEMHLSQTEFGELTENPQTTICGIENGKNEPKIGAIIKICKNLHISADWLLLDQKHLTLREEEKELLNLYNQLSERGKIKLEGIAEQMVRDENEKIIKENMNQIS